MNNDQAQKYSSKGRDLICPFCGHDEFWAKETLMNTRGATFLGFDWANRTAQNYICNECGYVFWFIKK